MKKNLWFLTEERPKKGVLKTIFKKFAYVFSKRFLDNTVVVFTHWDESEKAIYTR